MDPQTLLEVMFAIAERTEGDPETRFAALQELLREADGKTKDSVQKPKLGPSRFERGQKSLVVPHTKGGFTGQKPDSTGRVQCFTGGVHVPCAGKSPIQTRRQGGGKTSSARGSGGDANASRPVRSQAKLISTSGGGSAYVTVGRPDHLADQMLARKVYSLFVNSDLKAEVKETKEGTAVLLPVPEGSVPLSKKLTPETLKKVQGSFILDAYLSNWSVAGEDFSHVMVDPKGKVYRMDMTGALRFHEDGTKKTPEEFPPEVIEVETFLDGTTHPELAKIYQGLKPWDQEVVRQAKILLSRQEEVLGIFPDLLKEVMTKRMASLQKRIPSGTSQPLT